MHTFQINHTGMNYCDGLCGTPVVFRWLVEHYKVTIRLSSILFSIGDVLRSVFIENGRLPVFVGHFNRKTTKIVQNSFPMP